MPLYFVLQELSNSPLSHAFSSLSDNSINTKTNTVSSNQYRARPSWLTLHKGQL